MSDESLAEELKALGWRRVPLLMWLSPDGRHYYADPREALLVGQFQERNRREALRAAEADRARRIKARGGLR